MEANASIFTSIDWPPNRKHRSLRGPCLLIEDSWIFGWRQESSKPCWLVCPAITGPFSLESVALRFPVVATVGAAVRLFWLRYCCCYCRAVIMRTADASPSVFESGLLQRSGPWTILVDTGQVRGSWSILIGVGFFLVQISLIPNYLGVESDCLDLKLLCSFTYLVRVLTIILIKIWWSVWPCSI